MTAQIIDLLKENFKPIDNIPRNHDKESQIILEAGASLYIDSIKSIDKLPIFIRKKLKDNYSGFDLPNAIIHEDVETTHIEYDNNLDDLDKCDGICNYKAIFNKFKFIEKNPNITPELQECSEFYINNSNKYRQKPYANPPKFYIYFKNGKNVFANIRLKNIYNDAKIQFEKINSYNLFKQVSSKCTTQKIYDIKNNQHLPYAPFESHSKSYFIDSFQNDCNKSTLLEKDNYSEEAIINNLLKEALGYKFQFHLNKRIEKFYSGWYQPVISYYNNADEVDMRIIKIIDDNHEKLLIPITNWIVEPDLIEYLHCVPYPTDKQPLYNITENDEIDENTTVILTDSLEIAALNKNNFGADVKWVSFMCHEDMYEQVDFSLLENVKNLHLLVTNHSGISLEETYKSIHKLATHLKENYDIKPKFVQLATEYGTKGFNYANLDDITKNLNMNQPKIIENSIIGFENFADFKIMHDKAMNQKYFWEIESNIIEKEKTDVQVIDDKTAAQKYILRPIIIQGTITFMYAKSGLGKINLGLSLAAAIVSGKKPIRGKSWNVRVHSDHDCNKVLYLDFESGATKTSIANNQFTKTFFAGVSKKDADNLIIDHLRDENIDFSQEENHYKLLDKIKKAKDTGNKGQQIDLLVIDTFRSFSDNKGDANWTKIYKLLEKIRKKGIAILIMDHSTKDKKSMSGNEDKRRASETVIELVRENDGKTLKDPFCLRFNKNRGREFSTEIKDTMINFNDGQWQVVDDNESGELELKDFGDTVTEYRKNKVPVSELYDIMGLKKSAFSAKMNKYKELKEEEK